MIYYKNPIPKKLGKVVLQNATDSAWTTNSTRLTLAVNLQILLFVCKDWLREVIFRIIDAWISM